MAHQVKLLLCQPCAAKLREVRDRDGETKMAHAAGAILCIDCKRQIPGYQPDLRLVTVLKKQN